MLWAAVVCQACLFQHTLVVVQGVRYMALDGGAVIDSYTVEEKNWKFSEVVPETIGETIINFACKKAEPRRK